MLTRADIESLKRDFLPEAGELQDDRRDDIPLPESLAEYGLSDDSGAEPVSPSAAKSPAGRRLTFTRFADVKMPTTSRYLVKGVIPNVGMVVVWGPPKCGKSFFVFDLVAHVAGGWGYRGRRVKQCPVVYFALEGQEGFMGRIEAFRLEHGAADIPFYLSSDRIVLPQDGAAVVKSIREEFPDVRPGIVVLDTLNRSIVGSENDPADMGSYVRAADMIREAFRGYITAWFRTVMVWTPFAGHAGLAGAFWRLPGVRESRTGKAAVRSRQARYSVPSATGRTRATRRIK
jgi:hypothetical protein